MGEVTAISWADHTFNPWIGCSRVSDGCTNCYAEALSNRWGWGLWGKGAPRRVTSAANWREPLKWNEAARAAGRPALVFCASLADVFEDRPDLRRPRHDLFRLIEQTPHLVWMLLTKRPENVLRLVPSRWLDHEDVHSDGGARVATISRWPGNVWIGTTIEHQAAANARLPYLVQIPAPVRFVSHEPSLGRVVLPRDVLVPEAIVCGRGPRVRIEGPEEDALATILRRAGHRLGWYGVDWIIAGGESGPNHRPFDVDNARALRDQARRYGIPFFFKQHGGRTPTAGGDLLDGEQIHEWPAEAGERGVHVEVHR